MIDLAIKYGLNSHEAFTRSFKSVTDLNTLNYRKRKEDKSILEPIK